MIKRNAIAALSLSAAALVGIATHEGFVGRAYQDIVGVWTIGFGTTEGVKPGDRIEPVLALQRKMADVQKFEGALKQCVKVPLHQHEYDAFLSLAYNIGPGACREILRWNRAGGRVVQGLVNRREAEYRQCIGAQP